MPQFSSEARFKVHCFFSSTELLGGSSTLNKVYLDLLNGADSSLQHCLKLEVGNGKFPQWTLRSVSKVFLQLFSVLVSHLSGMQGILLHLLISSDLKKQSLRTTITVTFQMCTWRADDRHNIVFTHQTKDRTRKWRDIVEWKALVCVLFLQWKISFSILLKVSNK